MVEQPHEDRRNVAVSNPHVVVFAQIEEWYARAPTGSSIDEAMAWVQDHSEIPCPACGQYLWVLRGENAGGRGIYHFALCQSPDCDFQAAD